MNLVARIASTAAGVVFAGTGAAGGVHIVIAGSASARTHATAGTTSSVQGETVDRNSVFVAMADGQPTSVTFGGRADQALSAAPTSEAGPASSGTPGPGQGPTSADRNGPSTPAPSSVMPDPVALAGGATGAATVTGSSSVSEGSAVNASGSASVDAHAGAGPRAAGLTGDAATSSMLTIGSVHP